MCFSLNICVQFSRLENVLKSDEAKDLLDEALDPSAADFGAGLIEMLSNVQPGLESGQLLLNPSHCSPILHD